ncbi:MAG: RecX family transcriptional regulator [Coriobacteriales bacterium]|jgi:regulatory protein|nr:RecX family transcriptional regulator [Coriobacteriales bacterium]
MKRDLATLTVEEQMYEARRRTERLIQVRDRSEAELRDRLGRAGFSASIVEREVAKALDFGLVDNERFASLYVAGKKHRGWGRLRIEKELRRFGIELRSFEGYPEAFFTEQDELARAQSCLERFRPRSADVQAARYRRLISRGYSNETARAALSLHSELTLQAG